MAVALTSIAAMSDSDLIATRAFPFALDIALILASALLLGVVLVLFAIGRRFSGQAREIRSLREEAASALAQKDAMVRQLVEASPDAIAVHTGTKVVFANPSFVKLLLATTREQLIGRNIYELIHPDYHEAIRSQIEQRQTTGVGSAPKEFVLIAEDGSQVEVEGVGIPLEWEGVSVHEVVLRDISRRKRAEKGLSDWQKRHELAQKAGLRLGWWEWEIATGALVWSDEVYRLFGYTREEFGGDTPSFLQRVHPEDRPRVEESIREIVEGLSEYAAQFRVLLPDGSINWIDNRGVVIRDGGARLVGIAIDITALIRAQQVLQESQEQYLALLNSTAEAIYGLDLQGNCTFCNPSCLRLLGYNSADDLLGRNIHALIHHTSLDGRACPESECSIFLALLQGQSYHSSDEVLWREDGTHFIGECWSHPLHKAGKLVGAVVTFLDISERKRMEEAQIRSEQLFRLIAENSADLIAVVDNAGNRIYNNPAYRRILGFSPEELKATVSFEQIHPDDREMVKRTAEEAHRTGVGRMIEYRMRRKDGSYVSLESHGSFIRNTRGHIEAQVISARDISDRKVAAQAEKLSAIGQLAAGIAHEINTPVQYLSDNVSFLRDSWSQIEAAMATRSAAGAGASASGSVISDSNSATDDWAFLQQEIPNAITQSLEGIRRISKIVGAMRKFSHSSGGEKEFVDLNDALETTLTVAHNELKHIADVTTEFQADLPRVECFPDEMNQVFLNLIVNAAHAMRASAQKTPPQRGSLTVRTQLVKESVQIEIQDSGSGIPEHIRSRVFEPFFTTKQVGEGTGQGLAICHDIVVNKHRGKIWFETQLGKGTTFLVRLPIKPSK